MARLIDVDELINTLKKEKIPFDYDINYFITNAQTAFDIDKVVQELEELKTQYDCTSNEFQRGAKAGAEWIKSKAIEIVKRGGLNVGSEN